MAVLIVFSLGIGFIFGAAAIHRPMANTPYELPPARKPWNPKDIMGLLGSIGIRNFSGHLDMVPFVVLETDKTIVLKLSQRKSWVHYVLVPKIDIRDTADISLEDAPYMMDLFLTARHLIEKDKLQYYQVFTNGPGLQKVGYLHFHVVGELPKGS